MESDIIVTQGLTKRYGAQTCVNRVDLHVRQGRIYGLLGRNGAGKTTIMKMLLGLVAPTAGSVSLFGKPLAGNEREALSRIGCLIESPGFYPNLTGTENLRIFARLRGVHEEAVRSALSVVGLEYRDKKLFSQYSLGMKQRLAIALAMLHDPRLLILDEPVNGLDPIGIAEMRAFIRRLCDEQGKTVLISSHILPEIALLADDVGILDHGVLLEEESMRELEGKQERYVRLAVSDAARAQRLLHEVYPALLAVKETRARADGVHAGDGQKGGKHADNVHRGGNKCEVAFAEGALQLPGDADIAAIVRLLVQNDVDVREARVCEETLEEYFRRVTGGEGIA